MDVFLSILLFIVVSSLVVSGGLYWAAMYGNAYAEAVQSHAFVKDWVARAQLDRRMAEQYEYER